MAYADMRSAVETPPSGPYAPEYTNKLPPEMQLAAAGPIVKRLIASIIQGKVKAPPPDQWLVRPDGKLKQEPLVHMRNSAFRDAKENPLVFYRGTNNPYTPRPENQYFSHNPEMAAGFGDHITPAMINAEKFGLADYNAMPYKQQRDIYHANPVETGDDALDIMGIKDPNVKVGILQNMQDMIGDSDQLITNSTDEVMPVFGGSLEPVRSMMKDFQSIDDFWLDIYNDQPELDYKDIPFRTDWGLE